MKLVSKVRGSFHLDVLTYTIQVATSIMSANTRTRSVHYPVRYTMGNMSLMVQFSSVRRMKALNNFILDQHSDLQANPSNTLQILWPEKDINYRGIIPQTSVNRALQNFAPMVQLSIQLVKDDLYGLTDKVSEAPDLSRIYEDGASTRWESTLTPRDPDGWNGSPVRPRKF